MTSCEYADFGKPAEEIWPAGGKMSVHYNPENPTICYVDRHPLPRNWPLKFLSSPAFPYWHQALFCSLLSERRIREKITVSHSSDEKLLFIISHETTCMYASVFWLFVVRMQTNQFLWVPLVFPVNQKLIPCKADRQSDIIRYRSIC